MEIGHPVEMEFAVQLDVPEGQPQIFSFLQIRPIVEYNEDIQNVIPEEIDEKDTIIYAESAMGNGTYENIRDIIYIKPQSFNAAKTREMAETIEQLNEKLQKEERYYVLVGPGRWGSSDPWLGIPVNWGQVSSAKVIVEAGLDDFRIDPSQGTHFFQNITSFKVGYLTINPFMNDGFFDAEYLDSLPALYEDDFVRHVRFDKSLITAIDGKNNRAVVFKPGYVLKNKNDIDVEEIPPSGFF